VTEGDETQEEQRDRELLIVEIVDDAQRRRRAKQDHNDERLRDAFSERGHQ